MKKLTFFVILLAVIVALAQAPWLTEEEIGTIITEEYVKKQPAAEGSRTLIGFEGLQKTLFGGKATLLYSNNGTLESGDTIFVSLFNTVHEL